MPLSLDPVEVLDVANLLHYEHAHLDPAEWASAEDARHRSSVSRAYYAAFLCIKARLLVARPWPSGFPQKGVHGKVLRALRTVFKRNHRIPMTLGALLDQREAADYELGGHVVRDRAEDRCDDSEKVIAWIDALPSAKMTEIGNLIPD